MRGTASFISEVNELRAIKRRLKKLIKAYEEYVGFGVLEVSAEGVYEQLLEVLGPEGPQLVMESKEK